MDNPLKVVIASDFSGFRLKEAVREHLITLGYALEDVGQREASEHVLYFEAASSVAMAVQSGACERGIVVCGTGAGVSLIANKFKGVYCVACESVYTAQKTCLINNANVLAMGERVVSFSMGSEMAEEFLKGRWCQGFEQRRRTNNERGFEFMQELERRNFK